MHRYAATGSDGRVFYLCRVRGSQPLALTGGTNGQALAGYAVGSPTDLAGYILNTTNRTVVHGATVGFNVPSAGMAGEWIAPSTGKVISTFTTSGTPGSQIFTIPDFSSTAQDGDIWFRIRGAAAPVVMTVAVPACLINTLCPLTLSASGGAGGYTWAITAGALPPGLTLNASTGAIAGMATQAGNWNFSVVATDSSAVASAVQRLILVVFPAIAVGNTKMDNFTPGFAANAYHLPIVITGGMPPVTCAVTGATPPGLSFNGFCGASGSATAPGTYTFTVTATDGLGYKDSASVSTTVNSGTVGIEQSNNPDATVNWPFNWIHIGAREGSGGYTWAVTSGSLPAGLTLSSSGGYGAVSGTPTQTGTSTFSLTATDNTSHASSPVSYTLTVNPAPSIATSSLPAYTTGSPYYVPISVVNGTPPAWCVVAGALPAGFVLDPESCELYGTTAVAGTFPIIVTAYDSTGYEVSASYALSSATSAMTQTIAFGALSDVTFGVAPFGITATASSGLAVVFVSGTPDVCTVAGATVTILAVGMCSITASQPGDANYAAAIPVIRSLAVNQAPQTIVFGPLANQIVGVPPFLIAATASSGLPVSFGSSTTTVCTVAGATVTIVAAGTCSIVARQAGNAYYLPAADVAQSFTVTANRASQTITFGPLSGMTFGGAPFTIGAIASSGLAVIFASGTAGVCTVGGTTVTIVAAGMCSITASQPGNANYLPAANVVQSFIVTQASQSITFGALNNMVFGTAPITLTAAASSGLPVTFASSSPAVCAINGAILNIIGVGMCSITASQPGNANYAPAISVVQSFGVNQAPQTIVFGPLANQTMGTTPFPIAATASSGLAVSFASTTTAVCTVSGNAVSIIAPGTCSITASQPGSANYLPAPNVVQSFTVFQALQSITFGALNNVVFGTTPIALTATATSGLPVSFASITPAVCTTNGAMLTIAGVGLCSIMASQAGNANYLPALAISQNFFVTPASQSITFGALGNIALGTAPFTLSVSASSGLPVALASATPAVCTLNGATVTVIAAGTCSIAASQPGNANYFATGVTESFLVLVNAASQSITFTALNGIVFGTAPFTVTAVASSGLAVSFASTTPLVCTISGATVTVAGAGTCSIVASQAGNTNYFAAASVTQSFTVTSARPSEAGIFRGGFAWLLDANGNRMFDGAGPGEDDYYANFVPPQPGDIPVVGDWSGSGTTKIGIYRPSSGQWFLDFNGDGIFDAGDKTYQFGGIAGDLPVVGDWTGSGTSKIGIFRSGFFWLLDYNGDGALDNGDPAFAYGGVAGDVPVTGDWTGNGITKVGVVRPFQPGGTPAFWLLDANNDHAIDAGDLIFAFGGIAGDVAVVGDWNGTGFAKAGVFRDGFFWVVDNNGSAPTVLGSSQVVAFAYGGIAGDVPVAGKW